MRALRIGEKIGDLVAACKSPKLREINLEYNGIEPDFCMYFQMILNFETLEHLDISHNWVGHVGIEHLKDHFRLFKRLRHLNLSSNKIFMMPERRTEYLRDMLKDVSMTLEELHLAENSMESSDFDILSTSLATMPHLRVLNLNVNRICGLSMTKFLDLYLSQRSSNLLALESLSVKQNDLRDEGVADLLQRVQDFTSLSYINLIANKVTFSVLPAFEKFISAFDSSQNRRLTVDFTTKGFLGPKDKKVFLDSLNSKLKARDERQHEGVAGLFKINLI